MKNYVGRKCKGFRFERNTDGIDWYSGMKKHIDEIGEIDHQSNGRVRILFQKNYAYFYPISLIEEHLIPEEETNPVYPQHYGGGDNVYEAIKVIEAWDLGFNLGNTVKYIARCGKKDDELQELKKASWYLEREIAKLENAKKKEV
jgi:hypothetical protein